MGLTGSSTTGSRPGTPVGGSAPDIDYSVPASLRERNYAFVLNADPVDPFNPNSAQRGFGGPTVQYNNTPRGTVNISLSAPDGINREDCFVTAVSDDLRVIVGWGWYYNPNSNLWETRALAWFNPNPAPNTTYSVINLNDEYSDSPNNPHTILRMALDVSPNGRYIVGAGGINPGYAWRLELNFCTAHNGDVDRNGCVDDADLLAVLFAFGSTGSSIGRMDVNCDGVVDDADLLDVLFNFGSGC